MKCRLEVVEFRAVICREPDGRFMKHAHKKGVGTLIQECRDLRNDC